MSNTDYTENTAVSETTVYQQWIDRHYGSLLKIIESMITKLADSAVEIVAKGIALVAPLPNAINLANAVVDKMGWSLSRLSLSPSQSKWPFSSWSK